MNEKEIEFYEEKLERIDNIKNDIVQSLGYFTYIGNALEELETLDIASARRLKRQIFNCFNSKPYNNMLEEFETLKYQDEERKDYENSIVLRKKKYEKER